MRLFDWLRRPVHDPALKGQWNGPQWTLKSDRPDHLRAAARDYGGGYVSWGMSIGGGLWVGGRARTRTAALAKARRAYVEYAEAYPNPAG